MQVGAFFRRELAKRLDKDAVEDGGSGLVDLMPARGEPVAHGPARTGNTLDEATLDHPGSERAHRLVGLERELGEGMQRRVRLLAEVAQDIPLHERDAKLGQALVRGPVMAPLQSLDGQPNILQGRDGQLGGVRCGSHVAIISAYLYKQACKETSRAINPPPRSLGVAWGGAVAQAVDQEGDHALAVAGAMVSRGLAEVGDGVEDVRGADVGPDLAAGCRGFEQ